MLCEVCFMPLFHRRVWVGSVRVGRGRCCSGRLRIAFPPPTVPLLGGRGCSPTQCSLLIDPMKKKNAHKEQRATVGRPRRTVNFCAPFSSINKAFTVSRNTPWLLCVFVIIPLSHGSAESVDQSTESVCRSNLLVPFQGLSTLKGFGGVVRHSAAQSGSRPLFGSGNTTRTAPLRTEPTRTLRWKRAICDTSKQYKLLVGRQCWRIFLSSLPSYWP